MKKVIHIVSNVSSSNGLEWMIEGVSSLYACTVVLMNPSETPLELSLKEMKGVEVRRIKFRGKKDLIQVFLKMYVLLKATKPDIIHCHLYDACLVGLTTSRLAGVKKRIYTRHYSNIHHQYHPKGVWFDKVFNCLASDIIAISENVKQVLIKERARADKIIHLPHGFKLELFQKKLNVEALKNKYKVGNNYPVVGAISRFVHLKGVAYIVEAFSLLLKEYPKAKLLLFNAVGPEKKKIMSMLSSMPDSAYELVDFEGQIIDVYHLLDVFVHVPIDKEVEAFGQTYVEALAAGTPAVFTMSGVAPDFVKDEENAIVVDYKSSEQIYQGIRKILENEDVRQRIVQQGPISVEQFSLSKFLERLKEVYEK
ncbi:glycosyltransferase [Cytophagaceae bacterium ABcell3]|nr:glycosyltransferase [Cytophagaceae bacterium ABcell3]